MGAGEGAQGASGLGAHGLGGTWWRAVQPVRCPAAGAHGERGAGARRWALASRRPCGAGRWCSAGRSVGECLGVLPQGGRRCPFREGVTGSWPWGTAGASVSQVRPGEGALGERALRGRDGGGPSWPPMRPVWWAAVSPSLGLVVSLWSRYHLGGADGLVASSGQGLLPAGCPVGA